jgi:hypothetical protein
MHINNIHFTQLSLKSVTSLALKLLEWCHRSLSSQQAIVQHILGSNSSTDLYSL